MPAATRRRHVIIRWHGGQAPLSRRRNLEPCTTTSSSESR
jgi:hypothetical protein